MPNIKILTWNIETFGMSSVEKDNAWGDNVMNYLAQMILATGADIICIQEIMCSSVGVTTRMLQMYLNGVSYAYRLETFWGGQPVASCTVLGGKDYEGYAIYWNTNTVDLQWLGPMAGGTTDTQLGLYGDVAGNAANLPGNTGRPPGRGAAYALVNPVGSNATYLLMTYHAPSEAPGATAALAQMPAVWAHAQNQGGGWQLFDPPLSAVPAGLIICGDFNVDYITNAAAYDNLAPTLATGLLNQKTSLTNITVPPPPGTKLLTPTQAQVDATSTAPFLANAYDNFLYTGGGSIGQVPLLPPQLVDCIQLNLQTDPFPNLAQAFIGPQIWQTQTIEGVSTSYESYIVYRYAVSNHLPVLAYFTLL